jgi:hypothetical protein
MNKKDSDTLNNMLLHRDPKEDAFKNINSWKEKYDLYGYNYLHTAEQFKIMKKGGLIKPISIYTEILSSGGILIKVDKDDTKYFALLTVIYKNSPPKFWKIYLDKNYIFYKDPDNFNIDDYNTESIQSLMDRFIDKNEQLEYETNIKKHNIVDELYFKYKK